MKEEKHTHTHTHTICMIGSSDRDLLQQCCNVAATSLQRRCAIAATLLQRCCNVAATSLQRCCTMAATSLQRHCNVTATSLQRRCNVAQRVHTVQGNSQRMAGTEREAKGGGWVKRMFFCPEYDSLTDK